MSASDVLKAQVNDAVREAIRHELYYKTLLPEEYNAMSIAELRKELKSVLGGVEPNENNRLVHMGVSIVYELLHGYELKGRPPAPAWYLDPARQTAKLPAIADAIISNGVTSV